LIATGLSQVAYDRVKFYYRLKDHAQFLKCLDIDVVQVAPRMTRDFEVSFSSDELASRAAAILQETRLERDGRPLFGDIDLRGNRLFASLTYPEEIRNGDAVVSPTGNRVAGLSDMVAFVAIKNGMHSRRGFGFLSRNGELAEEYKLPFHISKLYDLTLSAARI
jgi:hypothetical protein